ncbi:MAG TPA: Rrf2 family transcriptional regulator [Candidatus Polarisedimenticolia bacterium]|nr:Rrf2 family transcriptional regulator [Candidatus Polarisedimenticolia bacterium]
MLRLSRETDYSLLALMYIAEREPGQLAYRRDIAAHYNIPREFLAKVLQKLCRRGLVKSYRGMQGGYALARRPETITLADVVEAIDGPIALVDCQCDPDGCPQEEACTVQSVMGEVRRGIEEVLRGISLEHMRRRLRRENAPRLLALKGTHP